MGFRVLRAADQQWRATNPLGIINTNLTGQLAVDAAVAPQAGTGDTASPTPIPDGALPPARSIEFDKSFALSRLWSGQGDSRPNTV